MACPPHGRFTIRLFILMTCTGSPAASALLAIGHLETKWPRRRPKFVTQCPRDDGCGVFVLQMLTGKPYDQIASMIDWGDQTNHYTTWKELLGA
jgi:hypothetical protein